MSEPVPLRVNRNELDHMVTNDAILTAGMRVTARSDLDKSKYGVNPTLLHGNGAV
jgi:hypothetical protein